MGALVDESVRIWKQGEGVNGHSVGILVFVGVIEISVLAEMMATVDANGADAVVGVFRGLLYKEVTDRMLGSRRTMP